MFMKSYTAIIGDSSVIKAVNVMVTPGDEKNPNLILDEYPDYNLIALVPGQHAKWSHVYRSDVMVDSQRKSYSSTDGSTKSVDVWEIEEENVDELT
tara:strand:+ start:2520 stop:2807 length:288 start_codon:yes stop_codon:yes gene_type:complete